MGRPPPTLARMNRPRSAPLSFAAGVIVVVLANGCAAVRPGGGLTDAQRLDAQIRALEQTNPDQEPIFDGQTGAGISWSEVVERASTADAVIIGEIHGHPAGLATATALFDRIASNTPAAALSLEFFARDRQVALDDYLAGVTDEDAFRKAASQPDANYPPGHRAMVERAKEVGLAVFASNAPRRYVHLARQEGLDRLNRLTDAQRRLFVLPGPLIGGAYRERFFELMSQMTGHGEGDDEGDDADLTDQERAERHADEQKKIESYYRSQNIWDATMADTDAQALAAGRRPVVQVVGRFHSDYTGGLVQRLADLAPDATILTIVMTDSDERTFDKSDADRADIVIHVGSDDGRR